MNASINLFVKELGLVSGKRALVTCRAKLKDPDFWKSPDILTAPRFLRMSDLFISDKIWNASGEDGKMPGFESVEREVADFADLDYSGYLSFGKMEPGTEATIYLMGKKEAPVVLMALELAKGIFDSLLTQDERQYFMTELVAYHKETAEAAAKFFAEKAAQQGGDPVGHVEVK